MAYQVGDRVVYGIHGVLMWDVYMVVKMGKADRVVMSLWSMLNEG